MDCALVREGKPFKVTVTLDADDPDRENLKTYKDRDLEFTLRDITDKERVLQRVPASVHGPRVEAVKAAGWASLRTWRWVIWCSQWTTAQRRMLPLPRSSSRLPSRKSTAASSCCCDAASTRCLPKWNPLGIPRQAANPRLI